MNSLEPLIRERQAVCEALAKAEVTIANLTQQRDGLAWLADVRGLRGDPEQQAAIKCASAMQEIAAAAMAMQILNDAGNAEIQKEKAAGTYGSVSMLRRYGEMSAALNRIYAANAKLAAAIDERNKITGA